MFDVSISRYVIRQADLARKATPVIIKIMPIQRVIETDSWKMQMAATVPKM